MLIFMRKLFSLNYKALRRFFDEFVRQTNFFCCTILFYLNNVDCRDFQTNGLPFLSISRDGFLSIGKGLKMNNNLKSNPIGRSEKCIFFVDKGAKIIVGDNVGISGVAIVAHLSITIGNNVKIGGGVCIYDTDFHSIDPANRNDGILDKKFENKQPVIIEDNVFIGAHSTILKGVKIGENSLVGACSVVTKSIPSNEIWGGNPARFIKKIK